MRLMFHRRTPYLLIALIVIGAAAFMLYRVVATPQVTYVTTAVERGDVRQLVSVSGVVEAENTAALAFPTGGIVRTVEVAEGERVAAGDVLATIEQQALLADRQDALAALAAASADRDELVSGPRAESRAVTESTVTARVTALERITAEETQKVANALRALRSNDLRAVTGDAAETAEPPAVSGTYRCDNEGTYTVEVYPSRSASGYSYRVTGLETGTFVAAVEQPAALGSCGLELQFDADSSYSNTTWTIAVPNTQSATYLTYRNAYDLATEQAASAIEDATAALELARREQTLENATPREEALTRADAAVAQAAARLARVDAELADRTLRAPFAGTITDVDILPGETVTTLPVITLLAADVFELTARIPEIDITDVTAGLHAEVVFDARTGERLDATVTYVSPLATEIDGVAYYEATLSLAAPPAWLRSGLNADVDIVVDERTDVTRLPSRFIGTTPDGQHVVYRPVGEAIATSSIEVGLVGNDGFIEVTGVTAGDVVVAP